MNYGFMYYEYLLRIHVSCSFIEYMLHHMHIEESEVPRMCLELYKEYGTTMAGLKVSNQVTKKSARWYNLLLKFFYVLTNLAPLSFLAETWV